MMEHGVSHHIVDQVVERQRVVHQQHVEQYLTDEHVQHIVHRQ